MDFSAGASANIEERVSELRKAAEGRRRSVTQKLAEEREEERMRSARHGQCDACLWCKF